MEPEQTIFDTDGKPERSFRKVDFEKKSGDKKRAKLPTRPIVSAIKNWFDVRYSTFNIQILNVEYRISNSIQHYNRMSNIEYQTQSNIQIECRISNIKLNPTFKSNVEYRISNSIQHSNRMSNIEYQTKSNIQIECRISNIKLNLTVKF